MYVYIVPTKMGWMEARFCSHRALKLLSETASWWSVDIFLKVAYLESKRLALEYINKSSCVEVIELLNSELKFRHVIMIIDSTISKESNLGISLVSLEFPKGLAWIPSTDGDNVTMLISISPYAFTI
jgi:hypothetical protein